MSVEVGRVRNGSRVQGKVVVETGDDVDVVVGKEAVVVVVARLVEVVLVLDGMVTVVVVKVVLVVVVVVVGSRSKPRNRRPSRLMTSEMGCGRTTSPKTSVRVASRSCGTGRSSR